ncbi:MAG: nuclease-related domain-containing protein [Actinomycetota bacterium]
MRVAIRSKPRAGMFAEKRYLQARAEWRAGVMARIRWATWPVLASAVIFLVLRHANTVDMMLALLAGGALVAYHALRDDEPESVSNWQVGMEGERSTERELLPLEDAGWIVRHDVERKFGVDHIVVGPNGVFLLETKNFRGRATIDGGMVAVTRPGSDYRTSVGAPLRRAAVELSAAIRDETGVRVWIEPVAVLWSQFDSGARSVGGLTYLHGSRLAEWIRSHQNALRPDQFRAATQFFNRHHAHS